MKGEACHGLWRWCQRAMPELIVQDAAGGGLHTQQGQLSFCQSSLGALRGLHLRSQHLLLSIYGAAERVCVRE